MNSGNITFGKTYEVVQLSYRDKGLMNLLGDPDEPIVYRSSDNDPSSRAMLFLAANTIDSFVQYNEADIFSGDADFQADPRIVVMEPRFNREGGILFHTGGKRSEERIPLETVIEEGRLVSVKSPDGRINYQA